MTTDNLLTFLLIISPLFLGFTVSLLFKIDKEWYDNIKKPKFVPPSYVFSIVWSLLYILFGTAMYLGLNDFDYKYWILPVLHFILNLSFTPLMFGQKNLYLALIATILTSITCIFVMIQFYLTQKMFSIVLLIPYLSWLIFATYLSFTIYKMNL